MLKVVPGTNKYKPLELNEKHSCQSDKCHAERPGPVSNKSI